MRGPPPPAIDLTPRQRALLERLVRQATCPQRTVQRARILLACAEGLSNQHIATQLGINRERVHRWRHRWVAAAEGLARAEAEEDDALLRPRIETILSDAPRRGSPAIFSPEQIIDIIAVACEDPQDSGHPLSHWTPSALAREVIHRGLVASISSRQVGRFLKGGGFKAPSEPLLASSPI